MDPIARLSKITERTEESRPSSGVFSASGAARPANPTPDTFRRSALLGKSSSHSRSSTDPGSDRGLPPPGRATELIAVFETSSPAGGHSRTHSTPGVRSPQPSYTPSHSTPNLLSTTGYTYSPSLGYSYGGSRPSSPSKSRASSSVSYTATDSRPPPSSFLSPPPHSGASVTLDTTFRSTSPGEFYSRTGSYLTPSTYSTTFSRASTQTGPNTRSYTDTATFTNTRTSITPPSTLHRPQAISRSPLTSVRNIVALWKERTPTLSRPSAKSSVAGSMTSSSPPVNSPVGLGRPPRLDETNSRHRDLLIPPKHDAEATSIRSVRSTGVPPDFDAEELSPYTQSNEAVSIFTTSFLSCG